LVPLPTRIEEVPRGDKRRNERIPCTLPVRLSWTDADGSDWYAHGNCRDISLDGLRIETTETIPAHSYVNLRIEKVDVAGSARVRYFRRGTASNVIGLELGQQVSQQLLEALRGKI
jgi:PilZ domain